MTKNEADLIIAEQNKSTEEILKVITKVKSDFQELCTLKSKQLEKLEIENAGLNAFCKVLSKRIEELEKENAELEKENAELKTKLLQERETYWSKGFNYSKDKLSKAKRYIKELLRAVESSYSVLSWQRPPIKAEAEQFLKETEND